MDFVVFEFCSRIAAGNDLAPKKVISPRCDTWLKNYRIID